MNHIKRFLLLATVLTTMLILVACGDDNPDTPPVGNTAVSLENPASLIGNYELVSFNQSNGVLDLATDNLSQMQSFKGQATIEIIENKVIIKSKVQLESVDMDSPLSVTMAGDQSFQLTNYKDNFSLAPEAVYNAGTQSISANNITITQEGDLVVVASKIEQPLLLGGTMPVDVTVKLKKVNDAVIGLSAERYWTNNDKLTDGVTIAPKALTSYYRITGTAAESTAMTATEYVMLDNTFRGNMAIVFTMGGIPDGLGSVKIHYKFQDPSNLSPTWQGYRYGVATYDIKRYIDLANLSATIVQIFQDLGAEVIDEKTMKITFKSPLDDNGIQVPADKNNTTQVREELVLGAELPIPSGQKIVFTLEKLYDGTLIGGPTADQHPLVQDEAYYK